MSTIGIIPARYASTRFPGKPLADIKGKPMIWWVYTHALQAKSLDQVVVATDDDRILEVCTDLKIPALRTSEMHQSGSARCAEAAQRFPKDALIVNIQGDEPFIKPEQIDALVHLFKNPEVYIGTLIKTIKNEEELFNPNRVKVVVSTDFKALLFSRAAIPFHQGLALKEWINNGAFYKHIGLYGYRNHTLQKIVRLAPSDLEKAENLEQLRWLAQGYAIQTALTEYESPGIDTPEDLRALLLSL